MLPLDPFFLMIVKFFIVVTCIVFWLRLGVRYLTRGYRVDGRRHHRMYDVDDDDE
jgi:hypothetical protein